MGRNFFPIVINKDIIFFGNLSGQIKHRTVTVGHRLNGIQLVSKVYNFERIAHTDEESIRCNSLRYESLDSINLNPSYIIY